MKLISLFSLFLILGSLTFLPASPLVYAQGVGQYGVGSPGAATGDVTLSVDAQDKGTTTFSGKTPTYKPGDTINMRVYMKNNTDQNAGPLTVKTTFPPHLQYTSGEGTYDGKTRVLTTNVKILAPKEEKNMFIQGKVTQEQLPDTVTCETVETTITYKDQQARDQAQICIQDTVLGSQTAGSQTKGGLPIISPTNPGKTPSTGPEALSLVLLGPASAAGYYLRRLAYSKKG